MLIIFNSLFIILFYYNIIYCYIVRLPDCTKFKANFSIIHHDTFYNSSLLNTLYNITIRECVLSCVTTSFNCTYVNYNHLNETCQLQRRESVTNVTEEVGWTYLRANEQRTKVGPICYSGNFCAEDQVCYDDCSSQGYTCKTLTDAIPKSKFSSSGSEFSSLLATDGLVETSYITTVHPYSFIRIDMGATKEVHYIAAKIGLKYRIGILRIGNIDDTFVNDICTTLPKVGSNRIRTYYCDKGPMYGRYIFHHRLNPAESKSSGIFEIEVYSFEN